MTFTAYFNNFCDKHGYTGKMEYDEKTKEYSIIITKGDDNAGIFMTKEELKAHSNKQMKQLLETLHQGFQTEFHK